MPHEITQCYLPPGRGDIPALTPAVAAERPRLPLIDIFCRGALSSNLPHAAAATDGWDRQTDGRTLDHFADPAPHTMTRDW